jgi:hypothetical protein
VVVTAEPTVCCLCGKKALYNVNCKGYCASHKEAAIAAKKGHPIERVKIESEFKRRDVQR